MVESIYRIIGGNHKFQIITMVMVIVNQFNNAINVLLPIFINKSQRHFCIVPKNESALVFEAHRSQFVGFDNNTGLLVISIHKCLLEKVTDICTTIIMEKDVMTSTVRQQYGLICQYSGLSSLSVFLLMFGVFLGSLFGGVFVDKFGRIKGCFLSYYLMSIFATVAIVSPWFTLHAVARFFVGVSVSISFISNSAMVLELVALRYRTTFGFMWSLGYDIGYLLLVIFAFFIRNHIYLQITTTALSYVSLIFPFFYQESFRWFMAHEMYEKAVDSIKYVALYNNQSTCSQNLKQFVELYHKKKLHHSIQKVNLKKILQHKVVLLNMVILWFIYFSTAFSYYAFILGSSSISSDLFVGTTISAICALLIRICYMFFCMKFGRIAVLVSLQSSLAILFICSIAVKILLGRDNTITSVLLMVSIGVSGTNFGFMWIYGGEAFPTVIRSTSVSIGSACSRISGMISSQMEWVFLSSPNALPIVGAILSIIGTFSSLFILPETFKKPSLDFLEQAEVCFVERRQPWRNRCKVDVHFEK